MGRALFILVYIFDMLSLAPIRYSKVLSQHGGPIANIEYFEGEVAGMPCIHALSYLKEGLFDESYRTPGMTERADGAGSHKSTQIACHMAISEALERWAVYHCRQYPEEMNCGMELDSSSNGFAAFPGLFRRQARKAAFAESIERHCLICWWEGLLGHRTLSEPMPGVRAIQVDNPFSSHTVIILWTCHESRHVISFGAGEGLNQTTWRALVELERTREIVGRLLERDRTASFGLVPSPDVLERRINYFSSKRGMSAFLDRLEQPVSERPKPMKLLFDGVVPGPWDRYVSVWRTIIEPPSREYLSQAEDYFFW